MITDKQLRIDVDRAVLERLIGRVSEFIARAPQFEGDLELARQIGEDIGKLEAWIEMRHRLRGIR